MANPGPRSLFFDLDGTLTDPKEGITGCVQYALECLGEHVPHADELTWCIGPPLLHNFEKLVGAERAAQGARLYQQRFADVGLFENQPYAGIHDTLEGLRSGGFELHVASSKPKVFVDRILTRYELAPFFSHVFGPDIDGTRAEKSVLLNHALTTTGIDAAASTMIGDRKFDAIGAQHNGLDFVGVLYGYGDHDEMKSVGVDTVVNKHEELLDIFTR